MVIGKKREIDSQGRKGILLPFCLHACLPSLGRIKSSRITGAGLGVGFGVAVSNLSCFSILIEQ